MNMSRKNAMEIEYTKIRFHDIPAYFTDYRIDLKSVPEGFYCYEIRHCDDDWSKPAQIGKKVLVNFFGTVLIRSPLSFLKDGYWDIDTEKEWDYQEDNCCMLENEMGGTNG